MGVRAALERRQQVGIVAGNRPPATGHRQPIYVVHDLFFTADGSGVVDKKYLAVSEKMSTFVGLK